MLCGVCNTKNADNATVCRSCGSPLSTVSAGPATTALQPGAKLDGGKFTVERVLGQGGFGITYLAREASLRRRVAIKEFFPQGGCVRKQMTVHPDGALSPADYQLARQKFLDEARVLARFHNRGIVEVYATFEENNTAYFAMEFVEGKTLLSQVESRGPLPEKEVVEYARQAADALTVVHQASLLHRDIKPENLLVTKTGRVVLVDFGTARQFTSGKTRRMTATVTHGYAPLEQYGQQSRFGVFTDVYALGATCYHLLTGQIPVQATDRVAGVDLPPPCRLNRQVSQTVSDTVMWAMEMRADRRPQSTQEFVRALMGTGPTPRPASFPPAPPQPPPTRPQPVPLAGATSLAAIKWLALAYLVLLIVGAFSHPMLLGLLVTIGLVASVPLMIYKRTWGIAGVGCILAPLLGALIGNYGTGGFRHARNPPGENRGSRSDHMDSNTKASGEAVTNSIGMKLAYIPAGEFKMGAPDGEYKAFSDERPQRLVRITEPFYLGVYEVTQGEYGKVMGTNPSVFQIQHPRDRERLGLMLRDTDRFPVENVSWDDAVQFCQRLSGRPEEKAAGRVYRLPTEAEWEYACRAGTTTPFHFGSQLNGREANSDGAAYGTSEKGPNLRRTAAVGSYAPNAFGLYDMHGNVNEWCEDWDGLYSSATVSDPMGPASGELRVFRGGSWKDWSGNCRSAARNKHSPSSRGDLLGFRVAMTQGSPSSSNSISTSGPVVEPPTVTKQVADGSQRAFTRSGGTAGPLAPSAPVAPIPRNTTAALSPAGKDPRTSTGVLAFVSQQGRKREIFSVRPDGSGLRSLTEQLSSAFAPAWSPDGKKILFRGGGAGDFYVIGGDGGNLKKVLDCHEVALDFPQIPSARLNAGGSWLPDNKTVAVCAGSWPDSSNVYLVDLASLKRTTLPLAKAAWNPVWSPDGTRIAFTAFSDTASSRDHPFQVVVASAEGTQKVPACGECDVQAGPLWLPNGKQLVFVKHGAWANGKQNNRLCLKNIDTGEFTETDFSWDVATIVASPDGQKIAFSPRQSPIYVFQLLGTTWQQVANIENGGYPTWSPDGSSLAYVSSADQQIWLANSDGSGQVRVTSTPGQKESPLWSPTAVSFGDSTSDVENSATLTKPLRSQAGPEQKPDGLATDGPRVEPPWPKTAAPATTKRKPRADESEEKDQANTSSLAGRWKEASGAEFSIEDDGETVSVTLLKKTTTMTSFIGSLARREGDAKSKTLTGKIDVTFRANPSKTYSTKATVTIDSAESIRLRWEDVPVFNASGKLMGTRLYAYTLTKQE
jgi:formylglycine-generating enzyme required for sulfatase activity/serine/threonine protein kinase/Tol biopolymer transport system component